MARKELKRTIELTECELIMIRAAIRAFGYAPSPRDKEERELFGKEISSIDIKMTEAVASIFDEAELNIGR